MKQAMRLSIEISPEQLQRLKALAARQGKSIKDYVLDKTLPNSGENLSLQELEGFLAPCIAAAHRGELSTKSVDEIFAEVELEESNA